MSALSALFRAHALNLLDLNEGCAIEECLCPVARDHFTFQGKWMATADRYPTPGSRGGQYAPDNVRLAHAACNSMAGGRLARNKLTRKKKRELAMAQ